MNLWKKHGRQQLEKIPQEGEKRDLGNILSEISKVEKQVEDRKKLREEKRILEREVQKIKAKKKKEKFLEEYWKKKGKENVENVMEESWKVLEENTDLIEIMMAEIIDIESRRNESDLKANMPQKRVLQE